MLRTAACCCVLTPLRERERRALVIYLRGLVDQILVHVNFPQVVRAQPLIVKEPIGNAACLVSNEVQAASMRDRCDGQ